MNIRPSLRSAFWHWCVLVCLALVSCSQKNSVARAALMTGMVETAEIDVAAKVPGRIAQLRVDEGQTVRQGDTIAILESRQFDAKVGQALGGLSAARAKLAMAQNGLRPQEKDTDGKNVFTG